MSSAIAVLTVVVALTVAALVALYLPIWASLGITLAVVLSVAIGGGALLAKTLVACALAGLVAYFWRKQRQARALPDTSAGERGRTLAEARPKGVQASPTRRRAA